MEQCECGKFLVSPMGPPDATILLVGDSPDFEELSRNAPYSGKRGEVLRAELIRANIDVRKCRVTYACRHAPAKECKGHLADALQEMKGKKFILLIGAATMASFGIENAQAHIGLQIENFLFPKDSIVMGCLNPPQNSAVGEFRLTLEKFSKKIKENS